MGGGLGEIDLGSFFTGVTTAGAVPIIILGGILTYMAFFGKSITERRKALTTAKQDYRNRVKAIKKQYPRIGFERRETIE